MDYEIITGDALKVLGSFPDGTADVICTSPPYNIGKGYVGYNDCIDWDDYYRFTYNYLNALWIVLKSGGSFFLNIGFTSKDPLIAHDLIEIIRHDWWIQNQIIWVKSIAIGDTTYGHFKPINSERFLNNNFEYIFHLTHKGDVKIDRLAVGVPYMDEGDLTRGNRGKNGNRRCRGNVVFLPYETVQSNKEKGNHPAVFPVALAEYCIKLHGVTPGMTVLDPFAGTGTTVVAAAKLGCHGIGIEIDEQTAHFARRRIAKEIDGA